VEYLTLTIGLTGSIAIIFLSPVYGFILYCATLLLYPPVPFYLGSLNFTVDRIVILAVFARILCDGKLLKKFRFIWLDALIVYYFIAQFVSGTIMVDFMKLLENRLGGFFDCALPYFAIRIIIRNRAIYRKFLQGILCVGVVLAIASAVESLGGYKVYAVIWPTDHGQRWGLSRAVVTFSTAISLGMALAMLGAICTGLIAESGNNRIFYLVGLVIFGVGVFFTLSSGPYLSAILSVGFMMIYRIRYHWRKIVTILVIALLFVEIVSDRHFYSVADRFTFSTTTAWYRARLFEVAIIEGGMSDHWLFGYGFEDPRWCDRIDGRDYTDIVNHYLVILARYGILGFMFFGCILWVSIRSVVLAIKAAGRSPDTWMIWCLMAGLFGILLTMNTAALFGKIVRLFYIVIGLCANSSLLVLRQGPQFHRTQ
jgi:hypothetical protein